VFAALAALLLGGFSGGCASPDRSAKAAAVKSGKERRQAPDFSLKDSDGRTVRLSDYRGKVVLLNFWATWCGPCRIEIPWFTDMERQNKDQGFAVLGVAMDDEGWEVVKPFLSELKVNYRVVVGNDETASKYGGIEALPTTFFIDRNGKIAAVHQGLVGRKEFDDGIRELLEERATASSGRATDAVPASAGSAN
jgi:cytochrome c biogenesis protein CcmG/thiol:disulfide interchange protein DsbE